MPLEAVCVFPSEVLHHERVRDILFLCIEAIKSLDS